MKKAEIILWALAVLGLALRIFHLPGGAMLSVLSFSLLSLLYYFSFLLMNGIRFRDIFKGEAYKKTSTKRIIGALGVGFALSTIVMGSLFKLMFWPGSIATLKAGLLLLAFICAIALILYLKSKSKYYVRIFKRAVIIGGLGILLYATSNNSLVNFLYGHNPEYAELFIKALKDPQNDSLRNELEKMRRNMDKPSEPSGDE